MKRPSELDDDAAAFLACVNVVEMGGEEGATLMLTKKAKVFDKGVALTLAMRHLGMLKDKVEHSGEIKTPELKLVLHGTRHTPKTEKPFSARRPRSCAAGPRVGARAT